MILKIIVFADLLLVFFALNYFVFGNVFGFINEYALASDLHIILVVAINIIAFVLSPNLFLAISKARIAGVSVQAVLISLLYAYTAAEVVYATTQEPPFGQYQFTLLAAFIASILARWPYYLYIPKPAKAWETGQTTKNQYANNNKQEQEQQRQEQERQRQEQEKQRQQEQEKQRQQEEQRQQEQQDQQHQYRKKAEQNKKMGEYYQILGLSAGATESEVKKRYNEIAKFVHPDTSNLPNANYMFNHIRMARDELLKMLKEQL